MTSTYGLTAALLVLSKEPSPSRAETHPNTATTAGPTVVTTLERLNAPAAKTVYAPISHNEIRLVTIHAGSSEALITCSLVTVSEDKIPNYEALSYVCKSLPPS